MAWWPFQWSRRTDPPARAEIVLYSRPGCHLCDDAEALLRKRQRRFAFDLVKTDIDASPELVRQYGDCVPVILVDGKLRFRGRIDPRLLDRLLRANRCRD